EALFKGLAGVERAEPFPRRPAPVLPKLTTALPLITKRAQHPKNTQKRLFRQTEGAAVGTLLSFDQAVPPIHRDLVSDFPQILPQGGDILGSLRPGAELVVVEHILIPGRRRGEVRHDDVGPVKDPLLPS